MQILFPTKIKRQKPNQTRQKTKLENGKVVKMISDRDIWESNYSNDNINWTVKRIKKKIFEKNEKWKQEKKNDGTKTIL